MNKQALFFILFNLFSLAAFADFTTARQVAPADVHDGYVTEKVWLQNYAAPNVVISATTYQDSISVPAHALVANAAAYKIRLGKELKRPFALIDIPVYSKNDAGVYRRLTGYSLVVTEDAAKAAKPAAKTTGPASSVLANGTWYKVGVTGTGVYKLDKSFFSAIGVNAATVNPANIRIYGNGGNMLSEDNSVLRPADLVENAAWMSGNGDAVFNDDEFLAFYAVGPTAWIKDSINQGFTHQNNLYSDTSFYFINFDQGVAGLRIASQSGTLSANKTVTDFNDYAVHDTDITSIGTFGKLWFGEQFSNNVGYTPSLTFPFTFGTTVSSLRSTISMVSVSSNGGQVTVTCNGQNVTPAPAIDTAPVGGDQVSSTFAPITFTTQVNSNAIAISINSEPFASDGGAYLDYIELNVRRPLSITGPQLNFRDWQSVGAGNVASYQLQGAGGATQVWDVTDPHNAVKMNGALSGSSYGFSQDAQMLHEFVAINTTDFPTPVYTGIVPNQNIHGSGQVNCLIVTYPGFLDAANELADFHRQQDNMSVLVVTTTQIYNEFSSGRQDISAIRDFARMFYERAGNDTTMMPQYLILFGGASYDYKNRVANNSNFVPTFESQDSYNDISGYSSDDFYGFLDDNENIENINIANTFDIAVGRIPARDAAAAMAVVNKIKDYKDPLSLGPWRIASMFAADNNDIAGQHMNDAEDMAAIVTASSSDLYNETKVYIDAIPTISTPAGARCPNANATIDGQVYKGVFSINYNGHGNTQVWATERILTEDDYNNWNNRYMLPFMVTATCDFGQFDHPQYVSAAEQLELRPSGGVITVLTTTAAVYAGPNNTINVHYLGEQFVRLATGHWHTFGEAYKLGKNITYQTIVNPGDLVNFRKFVLLGDPALEPDFPKYQVHITGVSEDGTQQNVDTLKALGAYTINGNVQDYDSNILTGFNGNIYITFFDKPHTVETITSVNETFSVQDNVIYKGRATVVNGKFSFSFIAPKDINYNYGKGKLSTYADDGVSLDAAGADTSFSVGGFSDNPVISTEAPVVRPYMNDSFFVNGGITGSNTSLFVILTDKTGINVSGNDVGHDLIAILDSGVSTPYILNDYYETAPNTYQRGYVSFPISGLADGKHSLRVRAWDVNNNVGEGTVNFEVVDGKVVDIQQLMNYPNPFTDVTHFVFEHNHPNEELDVKLNIYNATGALVKQIRQTFTPTGSRSNEMTWDGTTDAGAHLPSGVYVYKMNITTAQGIQTTAYQKLVLVR